MAFAPNLGKRARILYVVVGALMIGLALAGVTESFSVSMLLGIWGVIVVSEGLAGW